MIEEAKVGEYNVEWAHDQGMGDVEERSIQGEVHKYQSRSFVSELWHCPYYFYGTI